LYVYDEHARPPLAEVVTLAHARGVKVLVDAAGELPPRANLRNILASGADLVAFRAYPRSDLDAVSPSRVDSGIRSSLV
jgi:seryl-tRNA(Sec) selenium transferase